MTTTTKLPILEGALNQMLAPKAPKAPKALTAKQKAQAQAGVKVTAAKATKAKAKAKGTTKLPTKAEAKAFLAKGKAQVLAARAGSKLETIIAMMRRPNGATMAEMSAKTKWQVASVRGVIRNAVKGRLGLTVELVDADGGTQFKIVK